MKMNNQNGNIWDPSGSFGIFWDQVDDLEAVTSRHCSFYDAQRESSAHTFISAIQRRFRL